MPKMIAADELYAMLQSVQNGLTKLHEDPRFAHMASDIAAEITAVREIRKMSERMDAVDAEPVVRCKECKHRGYDACPMCFDYDEYDEDYGHEFYVIDRTVDEGFCHKGAKVDAKEETA